MTKGFKILLILAVVTLLLFSIILLLLNSSFAAKIISSKISNSFSGSLYWSNQHISLFTGNASVDNLAISESDGDTVIFAESVQANLSLLRLLKGDIIINSGTIKNPIINLENEKDSLLNIVSLFQPVSPKKKSHQSENPISITLSNIAISNGYFKYTDYLSNLKTSLKSINLFGSYDINNTIVDLNLKGGEFKFYLKDSISLDSLSCIGSISKSVIDSISFNAFNKDDYIQLSGKFNNLFDLEKLSCNYTANAHINTENYSFIVNKKLPLSGVINVDVDQSGLLNNPTSSILIKFDDHSKLKIFDSFDLGANISDRELKVDSLNCDLSHGVKIKSSGDINLKNAFPTGFISKESYLNKISYRINSSFKSLRDNRTLKNAAKDKLKELEGIIKLSGEGINSDSLHLNGTINSSSVFYPTKEIKDHLALNGNFSIKNQNVSIDTKVRSNYTGEGKINGVYNIKRELLNANISNLMLDSEIFNSYIPIKLKGIYTLDADFKGDLKKLQTDIFINGDNVNIDTVNIEKLRTIITIDNSKGIAFANLQASSNIGYGEIKVKSHCFNENSFTLKKDPLIYGDISVSISDISPIIRNEISGDLKVISHYEGSLNKGTGSAKIYSDQINHDIIQASNLNARLSYKDKNISIENLSAILPGGKLNASGVVQNFKTFELNSRGNLLLDSLQKANEYNTKGLLSFKLKSSGDFKTPVAQLSIDVDNPILLNQNVDSLIIKSNLIGNAIDFNIYSDFKSYGNFKLENQEYSIHTTLDSTDFMTFVLPKDQGKWNGTISGYSYIKGFANKIDSVVLDFYDFSLNYDTLNLANSEALSLYYGGDSLFVKKMNINLVDDGHIKCDGGFSSQGDGKLDALLKIPYSALGYFTDAVANGKGFVEGEINVKGDLKQPVVYGSIKSDSSSLFVTSTEQLLSNIKFEGEFNERNIKIENGFIDIDKGSVNFDGTLSSWFKNRDSASVDMNLSFNNVPVIIPDEGEFTLSGEVDLNTSLQNGLAKGNIKLLEGIYYKDLNLNLFSRERSVSKKKDVNQTSLLDNIKLDIQLLPYRPLTIDNNIAYIDVLPQVKLKGSASNPIVSGRAKVKDGFVTFRNREFKIKRGFLDFIDPYSNNPDIDIEAEVKIDKWIVTIAINGNTNDKLNFRLYSAPALSDREILSLLLIGRPEISGVEDAISVAGDFAGEYLGRTVERMNTLFSIPIDKVSVSSEDINEGLTVNIEQDVSKYLSTVYSINMKNGDVNRKAELLLRMFDNFSAKGFSETSGKRGFEVEAGFEKQ